MVITALVPVRDEKAFTENFDEIGGKQELAGNSLHRKK